MKCREFVNLPAERGTVTERNQAAAVLALLLALLGLGNTVRAQAQSMGSAASAPAASRGPEHALRLPRNEQFKWLRIMAFADAPVAGADVRVSAHGLPLVQVHAATNQYGVFPIAVSSHPSLWLCRFARGCRVSLSGGTIDGQPFLGHLMADVALTDPAHQIAVVNPVTTLVSRFLDARNDHKLESAEARVRSFLGLPAGYSLGLALRQSSLYASRFFSPVAFLKEAQAAGGLDAFEHLLLEELLASDSAKHLFPQPKLLGDTASSDDTSTSADASSSATSTIQAGLEAALLDYGSSEGVYSLTGWAMSLTGFAASAPIQPPSTLCCSRWPTSRAASTP